MITLMASNGISANNTSLLHKLGRKRAFEMTDEELLAIITAEQQRRSFQRSLGRTLRENKGKAKPLALKLEDLGLAPSVCQMLRGKGLSEATLITQIRKAGLL